MKWYLVQIFLFQHILKENPIIGIDRQANMVAFTQEKTRVRLVKAKSQIDAFEAVSQMVVKSKENGKYNFDGVIADAYNIQVTIPIIVGDDL